MRPVKVSESQKQIMASWILPKNECWDNFQYIKLSQRLFFGRIEDTIFFFRNLLTFRKNVSVKLTLQREFQIIVQGEESIWGRQHQSLNLRM